MQTETQFAFKEWSVVCAALAEGRQTLILRKGGIHEGREGFRVQHREFWLFPTGFHQQRSEVIPEAWPLLEEAQSREQTSDISLGLYAVVEDVQEVLDLSSLARLRGRHVWSDATVEQRFHYRTPGLFALLVRVYRRPTPYLIADSPHFAGCKSWVELPFPLSTSGLQPVLDDETFEQQRRLCTDNPSLNGQPKA
ncbi:MAG: DUF1802 family protein [Planctomycetaceae bacterium]